MEMRSRVVSVFLALSINLLLIGLLVVHNLGHWQGVKKNVQIESTPAPLTTNTIAVYKNINQLIANLLLQESMLDGYLITNQDKLVKNFAQTQNSIQQSLTNIANATHNPLGLDRIAHIKSVIDQHVDAMLKIKKLKTDGTILNTDLTDYYSPRTDRFESLMHDLKTLDGFSASIPQRQRSIDSLQPEDQFYLLINIALVGCLILFNLGQFHQLATAHSFKENNNINEELKDANSQLADMKNLLEMTDIMLATNENEELYQVITKYCAKILPFSSGYFYLLNDLHDTMLFKGGWGKPSAQADSFSVDKCWALRTGHNYDHSKERNACICEHLTNMNQNVVRAVCIPIRAQVDLLGLLYVEIEDDEVVNHNLSLQINGLSEVLSLAIANLQLRNKLYHQSLHDPLTNLYNRRFFLEFFTKTLRQHDRNHKQLGLLIIDIDYFKKINDRFGHGTGDLVLKEIAHLLEENCRRADLVARIGGEEFAIIVPDVRQNTLIERAEIIRAECEKKSFLSDHEEALQVTISIGAAMYPMHGMTPEKLISSADAALYLAKNRGRNNVALFNEFASSPQAEVSLLANGNQE